MKRKSVPILIQGFTLALLILSSAGCSSLAEFEKDELPGFYQVSESFARGGLLSQEGVALLAEMEFKSILSLEGDVEKVSREKESVELNGLLFKQLPMEYNELPSDEELREFLEFVLNPDHQPVYLHDAEGLGAVSTLVGAYRVLVEGKTARDAYLEAKKTSFRTSRAQEELKDYLYLLTQEEDFMNEVKTLKQIQNNH